MSVHAAVNFTFEHPSRAGPWFLSSNYVCLLSVPSENDLFKLLHACRKKGVVYTIFREPDLDNQLVSIALEPGEETQKLVKKLQLLFNKQKL